MKKSDKGKKKKKTRSQTGSTFLDAFLGEYVRIIVNSQTTQSASNGEMVESVTANLAFEGVLLDADELYYYLASESDEVNVAVKKDQVLQVSIGQSQDLADILLDKAVSGKVLN